MPPLISEEEMDVMDSGDESDYEPMSMDMLDDIRDGSKSRPRVNRIESIYKLRDCILKSQYECKGVLSSTRKMGKGLQKVFKAVVNDISQVLPILGESGSEFSFFFSEPRNFSEVTILSYHIKKPWLKATLKEIKI